MSTEKTQGKLQKLNLICKISQSTNTPNLSPNKDQSHAGAKRGKGVVFAHAKGKNLVLSNDQGKTDIIQYLSCV